MHPAMRTFAALAVLCIALESHAASPLLSMPAKQLLVVESSHWNAARGLLRRFERLRAEGPFRPVGKPLPVWLGRSGLASAEPPSCAKESACEKAAPAPMRKREGDGRSPAGIFALGELYGYSLRPPSGVRLPYHQSHSRLRCVDDPESPHYGQIVSAPPSGSEPWRSAEQLLLPTDHYKYLLIIHYNTKRTRPGAGSCIFLHVAPPPGEPTSGCTALAENDLLTVLRWLDPAKHPLLVQMPHEWLAEQAEGLDLPPTLFR